MRGVAPRGGNTGYFLKQGILCSAPVDLDGERKLDLGNMVVVDYFDPSTYLEEALHALDILEKYDEKYQ